MPECALPPNLRGKRHGDWPWPMSYIERAANAKGPRCQKGSKGYLAWPPHLIEGVGVSRWELSGGGSVIWIPALDNIQVTSETLYDRKWEAIEMDSGHSDFGHRKTVYIPPWIEATFIAERNGAIPQRIEPNFYSPSALQKFSREGYMALAPNYVAQWKGNEGAIPHLLAAKFDPERAKALLDGEWRVWFARWGWRPDHFDTYYNWGPFIGLRWE